MVGGMEHKTTIEHTLVLTYMCSIRYSPNNRDTCAVIEYIVLIRMFGRYRELLIFLGKFIR